MNRRTWLLRRAMVAATSVVIAQPVAAQMTGYAVAQTTLLERPARVVVDNVTVPQALVELQRRSGVPLVYSPSLLDAEGTVSCACMNVTVGEALDRILTATRFRYEDIGGQVLIERRTTPLMQGPITGEMSRSARSIAPMRLAGEGVREAQSNLWSRIAGGVASMFSRGEPGMIRGRVTDAGTQQPLAAVHVVVTGTAFSALTDGDGNYAIAGVPPGLYSIEANRIGYASAVRENVSVADDAVVVVDFAMSITALALDEIVATGVVDPTSARRVPFTVARVSGDRLQVPIDNAVNSIQGKVAGASIVTGAQPGAGVNVVLRSPTSINKSNSPLIVVDGVILATTFGRSSADIDALDIESIEIVKGAAAASLYGSRAAAGVIQIRTKRGTGLPEGQTRITVRSEFGANSLAGEIKRSRHHHYLLNSSGQYVNAIGDIVDRDNRVERPIAERFLDQPFPDPTFDHVEQFFDPGTYSTTNVSIAQNSSSTNFFASFAHRQIDGVVLAHDGYRMNDLRINLDHRLRSDLSFSLSAYHMRSDRDNIPDGTFLDLVQQAPDANLLDPDSDGTPYIWQPDPLGVTPNPLYALVLQQDTEDRARSLGSADLRYSPTGWLSIDGNLSYDRSDREQFFYFPRGMKTDVQSYVGGYISRGSGETTALNGSLSANLRRSFGDLSARLTLRALIELEDYSFFEAAGASLGVEGVPDLNASTLPSVSGNTEDIRSEGYFAIAGFDYAGKYILDALVRHDGSSLFGPDERWHTYYRGSAAWRMAEEPWWPFEQVDEFKLRYSRGTAGGRPDYLNRYETYGFAAGGGIVKNTLGNAALKPERSTEQEFGLDAIVFDRFSIQLNYARVVTEDQLVTIPLPAAFGFSSQWQNAGTIEGHTYEATLEARVMERPDLLWTLGFVADRSRNRITRFDRTCYRTGGSNQLYRCAGETLGTMYGNHFLRTAGELPEDAPASEFQVNDDGLLVWVGPGGDYRNHQWGTSADLGGRTYQWGMPILQYDETGSPAVVRIGDGTPDMHLGFSSHLRWKSLTFYTLFDSELGADVYNRTNQRMYQYFRSADTDQAGRPQERKKITDYYSTLYAANLINDWFIEDGTYLKLREASVRWDVPVNLLERVHLGAIDGASVFVIGRNLMTWTDYKGFDPEVGTPIERIDSFTYPQFRTVSAGVELRF